MVNHWYWYAVDRDFRPFFLNVCSCFPDAVKICLTGHEYLTRQLARAGMAFEALENGLLSCADPKRGEAICDRLSATRIEGLVLQVAARAGRTSRAPGATEREGSGRRVVVMGPAMN
jgi:hypothetical protein